MDLLPSQGISQGAQRLGERWRTVLVAELEEGAIEVWRDEELRQPAPEAAAARWLRPLTPE